MEYCAISADCFDLYGDSVHLDGEDVVLERRKFYLVPASAVVGFAVMPSTPRVLYSTSACLSQKTPLMVTAFKGPSLCGKQSAALRLGGTWRELLAWSPRPSYSCSCEQAIARFSACLQSVLVRQSALQHLCLDDP